MFYLLNQFICFYLILSNSIFISNANQFNCHLPERCRQEKYLNNDILICDINKDAIEFKFKEPTPLITGEKCAKTTYIIYFRWIPNDLIILDKQFNFTNMIRYFDFFEKSKLIVSLIGLKGFDINFLNKKYFLDNLSRSKLQIFIFNSRLDFYYNKKKLNSCQDFIDSNITEIESIFQIHKVGKTTIEKYLNLYDVEYKQKICPLVLRNTRITTFVIHGIADTFYKKNVFTFSDEIHTNLNSNITVLILRNAININLDLNIVHPSVFKYTNQIYITRNSFLNNINGDIFEHLKYLKTIDISDTIFRKINHKQGIKWIQQINHDVNVNLSNISDNNSSHRAIQIPLISSTYLKNNFPEEDFCIYVDFPFNQLVIVVYTPWLYIELFGYENYENFTCTFLWLIQYYGQYLNIYKDNKSQFNYLMKVFNSTEYKSISNCNFEQKIRSCNKSNFQIKDIWDESDFYILKTKLQIAFKVLLYPTAFLGLITNIIVVVVILIKENRELFTEYKQYSYLCLNSIFCIMISVIEILSWMNQCFYPFEVFCPEIRKLVAIQFFKIIFKECLGTMFRFMCNFTYVAFALNRISLIGNEHGKLLTFFSKLGIKKYIGITVFISALLSWINYFTYKVNYFDPRMKFPRLVFYSLQEYGFYIIYVYHIIHLISSFVNYFLFVVICVIIDVCMVVKLRRVLEEKMKKSESMNQKQNETRKAENEKVMNKAIKMVVINTSIGVFCKLPSLFISLLNLFFNFYKIKRKSGNSLNYFNILYEFLTIIEFFDLIEDITNLLFTLSLSIQMFIYYRFDKNFRTGYKRLMDKIFRKKKNSNQIKD